MLVLSLAFTALAKAFDFTFADLADIPSIITPYLPSKPLYLLASLLAFFFAYVEIRHRNYPLTVLSMTLDVTLTSPTGDRATVTRTQKIRANWENVTGYRRVTWVDPPGEMPRTSIRCEISHCELHKQSTYTEGDPAILASNRWEFIHRFDPIPRKLYFLGLNTVERTETIIQNNAYTRDQESYTLIIPDHYRHKRVILGIHFHPMRACELKDCEALRISSNGIINMRLRPILSTANSGAGVSLVIKKPIAGDQYKIIWRYPPLEPSALST